MNKLTNNNVNKCMLITSILILLLYLICTWDDEENIGIEDSIKIPKYKLTNELNNKYKLVNDNNINKKYKLSNDSLNSKLSNQNIFISHKNKNKYGLAF